MSCPVFSARYVGYLPDALCLRDYFIAADVLVISSLHDIMRNTGGAFPTTRPTALPVPRNSRLS
jgi:hypothetical protein